MSKNEGRANIFRVGAVATMVSQSYLVEVYITYVMSGKHILMFPS
jgi:hypothetical protein